MESPVATTFVVGTVAIYISYVYWLGATGPLAAFLSLQSKKTDDPDQIKIEQVLLRIHNKRCSAWVAGTALSSLCSEMYCIFLLVQSQFRGGIEDIAYSLHFWTAFSSAVLTRWASKPGGKTSRQQTMMLSILINLLGLLNSVDLSNHLMAANYLGRAFIGSFSPDIWFTVRVNFYLLPAFVACGYVRQGPERDLSILPILFVNEVVSVVFMAVILGQLNYLTIRQEQSTMELEESSFTVLVLKFHGIPHSDQVCVGHLGIREVCCTREDGRVGSQNLKDGKAMVCMVPRQVRQRAQQAQQPSGGSFDDQVPSPNPEHEQGMEDCEGMQRKPTFGQQSQEGVS
eukprot:g7301.t1